MLTGHYKRIFLSFCAVIAFVLLAAQLSAQKDPLKEGNRAFDEDHFREALIYYNQIDKINNSAPILFKRGVCYYQINQLDNAIEDFQRAWEFGYTNPEVDYYTGLIQHSQGHFALAATYYKKYLKEIDSDDVRRKSVRKLIKQCGRAIDLSYKKPLAIIEQLPGGINTAYDEIGLTESPSQEGRFYYTSNKPNTSTTLSASDYDIYWITKENGKFTAPKRMKYVINKRDNDILLGFTPDVDGLYIYRGKDHQGDIYVNTGRGDRSKTRPLELPTTFSLINSDVFFFNNEVVIFSSREGQGYGGYDLYASVYGQRKWSTPKNLGPEINGPFDEVSPYLSDDGSELYFSSNRDQSIGGHDIFFSRYLYEADKWGKPANLGIPINSPGDDTHFSLSHDGLTAMYSSDRKNAFGKKDNYIARFKDPRGVQNYAPESLAFLNYKIPHSQDSPVDDNLESDLTELSTESQDPTPTAEPTSPLTVQAFELSYKPIYYSSGLDLINDKNIGQLDQLINMMLNNPAMVTEFNCHSAEEGILEYKLFSSLKVAERLEQYFVSNGIEDQRIHIKGFADNYPLVKSDSNGENDLLAGRYNARVEIRFSNYDHSNISLNREGPEILDYEADTKFDLFSTLVENAITYKIRIAVVGQMYRGMALDLFNDTTVEEDDQTGLYAYTIGLYDNYAEALQVKRDMDRLGITDAQVVAYYDGLRLTEDQYVYYVNDFPDLRSLMNYKD